MTLSEDEDKEVSEETQKPMKVQKPVSKNPPQPERPKNPYKKDYYVNENQPIACCPWCGEVVGDPEALKKLRELILASESSAEKNMETAEKPGVEAQATPAP
jgi:hypothetical protein